MKSLKITLASTVALALAACAPEAETGDAMTADETAMSEEATSAGTIATSPSRGSPPIVWTVAPRHSSPP